jgi:hypothetical protein
VQQASNNPESRSSLALSGGIVRRASVVKDTGDLVLELDNASRLEILTSSSGYESWASCSPTGDETIGLGGGQVYIRQREG